MRINAKAAFVLRVFLLFMFACAARAWAGSAATTTTLAVSSGSGPVTSVTLGSAITLTATVVSGATNVTTGQVNFCDATATYCEDAHLLGTAQLTSAGAATIRLRTGIGSHSFKAVFLGTPNGSPAYSGSTSGAMPLTVTGMFSSSTSITVTGVAGSYALTATVGGIDGGVAPTGTVAFLDSTSGNFQVGSAALSGDQYALNWDNTQNTATTMAPSAITAADFNGDGIPDLAISQGNPYQLTGSLIILLGNGDGKFTPAATSPLTLSGYLSSVAAGDFNGDGIPDLAVVSNGLLTILLGKGDGTFIAAPPSVVQGSGSLVVADFNGDGIPDIALLSGNGGGVFLGHGDGTFGPGGGGGASVTNAVSLVAGDFRGNGIQDLAVISQNGAFGAQNNGIQIALNNGDGTFSSGPFYETGYAGSALIVQADFNGDGKADLAVSGEVLLSNGDGTFTVSRLPPAASINSIAGVAAGDFNGDGRVDLAFGAATYSGYQALVYVGNGDGTFTLSAIEPQTSGCPEDLVSADFNGDGRSDIATTNGCDGDVPGPGNAFTVLISQPTWTATATATGISTLGTGIHPVEANYPGDANYSAGLSTATSVTALPAMPTVTVTAAPTSITTAQQLQVTVTVKGPAIGETPTGSVTITSGSFTSTIGTLSGGSATITIPPGSLALGTDTLTANYQGDPNYLAASGMSAVTVTKATPTVTVTPSATSITTAQALTVTVAVSGGNGGATATGSVTLTGGGYTSAATALTSGSATITIPAGSLTTGSDTLTANYTPDSNSSSTYNSAMGTFVSVTVNVPPSFGVSGTAVTFAPGATTGNTSTITITPAGAFTGAVALTAAIGNSPVGAVEPPTLSFGATTPVTINGASNGTATLTVSTSAPTTQTCTSSIRMERGAPWYTGGGAVLAGVLLFGVGSKRRRCQSILGILLLFVALTGGVSACGGGGNKQMCTGTTTAGTTTGVYTITVTGTSGALTETGTVTLTVQ